MQNFYHVLKLPSQQKKQLRSFHKTSDIAEHGCVQDGRSCLCTASEKGHEKVVEYLCKRGGRKLIFMTDSVSIELITNVEWCL
jgi:hypothetical protein